MHTKIDCTANMLFLAHMTFSCIGTNSDSSGSMNIICSLNIMFVWLHGAPDYSPLHRLIHKVEGTPQLLLHIQLRSWCKCFFKLTADAHTIWAFTTGLLQAHSRCKCKQITGWNDFSLGKSECPDCFSMSRSWCVTPDRSVCFYLMWNIKFLDN